MRCKECVLHLGLFAILEFLRDYSYGIFLEQQLAGIVSAYMQSVLERRNTYSSSLLGFSTVDRSLCLFRLIHGVITLVFTLGLQALFLCLLVVNRLLCNKNFAHLIESVQNMP